MAKKKPYFDPVDTKADFPALERELLLHWYENGIVKKYLEKNKSSKKYFSFIDGPITANNPMGVHHGWGRTYKDLWQRFKNMQGFKQRFQNGFDSQGLWVEVEVEKELGFKSKKDIEKYGVAKFVQKCKDRVEKYAEIQTNQSKRLGYFMDWDNSYFTLSDENNYMIWHFLKVVHENGWLYKGHDSVPWCPRCETAISQHEMLTEDYKEVVHESVYFTLPINGKDEYLLVWTTTPWTIPANIAVAVDKKLDYTLVEVEDKKYWLAKDTLKRVFKDRKYKTVREAKGAELVGLEYKAVFDDLPAVREVAKHPKFHTVIATDEKIMPINTQEGTGLVHTAVSAGSEDFKLGQKLGLPMIPIIADNADYLEDLGFLTGKNAKKNPEVVLGYMRDQNENNGHWLYKTEKYKHRYPGCWRCKTELVWKVTDEWYISMDTPSKNFKNLTLRERMKVVAKKIDWIPAFGLKRELDWLNNMNDWLISKKNRYWGLALPVWECGQCEHFDVIGSKEELKARAIDGWDKFEGKSPHKPQIDEIKLKCPKCDGQMSRIEPVGNPWLDAGIVPYSTITENNSGEPLYSKDKKAWEKWFPADFITESFPGQFKNWFYSMIAMSTVLENREPFKQVLGYATLVAEDGRAMHKSWGNSIEFNEGADKIGVDVMRWMYMRQNPADNLLFGFRSADEVRRQFHLKLWNTYNFFVTYANLGGWEPSERSTSSQLTPLDEWVLTRLNQTVEKVTQSLESYDAFSATSAIESLVDDFSNWYIRRSRGRNDKEFFETTHYVLTTLLKTLAPFLPFMADLMYQNLTKKESVHLADWPESQKGEINKKLLKDMDSIRSIVEDAHSVRKQKGIPIRQPLLSLTTTAPFDLQVEKYAYLVKEEVNVKKWILKKGEKLVSKLDLNITPELEEEAKTRELIRNIQTERKKMGTKLTQKVDVEAPWLPQDKNLTQKVLKTALVRNLSKGEFKVGKIS